MLSGLCCDIIVGSLSAVACSKLPNIHECIARIFISLVLVCVCTPWEASLCDIYKALDPVWDVELHSHGVTLCNS